MDNGNGQKITNPSSSPLPTQVKPASMSPSSSPLPPKPATKTISFAEAIDEIRRGKKVTKIEWGNAGFYGFLHEARLRLHKPDNSLHDWMVSEGDIIGNDWLVIE